MNENNKGFTLIELLAVIVILSIILVIASTNVIGSINDSKKKAKYAAAKEIVQISEAYFATHSDRTCVKVSDLKDYLEDDATNPETGNNDLISSSNSSSHIISRDVMYKAQSGYDVNGNHYEFDGYSYSFSGTCE